MLLEKFMREDHLKQASELLSSVRGHPLTLEEREKKAIVLASHLLIEANHGQTHKEKKLQKELSRMMQDPRGKAFTVTMVDAAFRSNRPRRVADQITYLLEHFGIPDYLSWGKSLELAFFKELGGSFLSYIFVPLAKRALRKETETLILRGEPREFQHHLQKRQAEGVRLNINHLGEAILGEEEARRRLNVYLRDLKETSIDYVSVKISTIFSQINILAWDDTIEKLSDRLRELYRAAKAPKFVNLDMEEYRDLLLTKDLFKKVLSEPEFLNYSAGIVLQAYLPDSFEIQKELTEWAKERVRNGGAPIKIRIVKGANLAMERFEASVQGWPQAPYKIKKEVDANYKCMVTYGCEKENAKAAHLGVATHNLFDIAFSLLLRAENQVENEVSFEMLEGMADHVRRVVQKLTKDILLYCPVATKEDFQSAIAYLIRRLDENTGHENFLRHSFGLLPNTPVWDDQANRFMHACDEIDTVTHEHRRTQNRLMEPHHLSMDNAFENEPDTDFSLPPNRQWAEQIIEEWKNKKIETIPLVINGKEIQGEAEGKGYNPSKPDLPLYSYSLATWDQVDEALNGAKKKEAQWASTATYQRCLLLSQAAKKMRERRNDLIGVMVADGGKTIYEGDPEVSEAIDFAEYYLRSMQKMEANKDIEWSPKGTVLVTPPWNFPISIPTSGILAALVAGNCVLFKPAPEAVLSGWVLVNILWDAGIPKDVLQFINCQDDPIGSRLISDSRVNFVCLTGATSTAELFLSLRSDLDLAAETGGKNALIITSLSDRDLAIKDLIQSAFGHSGQKCSAASLAILEAEVYDDPHFREQLKDAVASLKVGSAWDLSTKIVPLIRPAAGALLKALTTLEPGEKWLLQPRQDPQNPNLWSPGIKWGVRSNSFTHQTELFGPVLGVMRAENLNQAIQLANGTPYGLTSGIHTLDDREKRIWAENIEAGNCYINRRITGAIVRRQPFGGTKASSFGSGSKAGGPNYVSHFARPKQMGLSHEKAPLPENVNHLSGFLSKFEFSPEQLGLWYASISNYAFWGRRFELDQDPSRVVGQDNILRYHPIKRMIFRVQKSDTPIDILRTMAAAMTCNTKLEISWTQGSSPVKFTDAWKRFSSLFHFVEESEKEFIGRIKARNFKRLRLLSKPSEELQKAAASSATYIISSPVLANGRFELLHFLREIALSIDYHRYGDLGTREGELRTPIL